MSQLRNVHVLAILMIVALIFGGCATTKTVRFESLPDGATVHIESRKADFTSSLITPAEIELQKHNAYFATYSLEGYHTVTVPVTSKARNKKQAAQAAGASVGTAGVVAPALPTMWGGALFVGGTAPFIVGMLAVAPIGIAAYSIHQAWPILPEQVHIAMTPLTEPAPNNAGDLTYWRAQLEKHSIKRPVENTDTDNRSRGAPGQGYRR